MDESHPDGDGDAIGEAVAACMAAAAELQSALDTLADQVRRGLPHERWLATFSNSWRAVSKRHGRVETLFTDLTEIVEDVLDSAEVETARQEPGDSIPWEQVKAELGLP